MSSATSASRSCCHGRTAATDERLLHLELGVLGEHALGLFDHDPGVQRMVQLLVTTMASEAARCCRMAIVAMSANAWAVADVGRAGCRLASGATG